mmetsp:Transcript_57684/g.95558  ORF Transcript_57684/g.95558 Transcript_57684/m.95558 type:complete len:211 (-) Transcript_57684:445-1077(-)
MLQHDSAGAHEVIWEICALRGLLVECFPDTNDWLSFALMTDGWRIFFFFLDWASVGQLYYLWLARSVTRDERATNPVSCFQVCSAGCIFDLKVSFQGVLHGCCWVSSGISGIQTASCSFIRHLFLMPQLPVPSLQPILVMTIFVNFHLPVVGCQVVSITALVWPLAGFVARWMCWHPCFDSRPEVLWWLAFGKRMSAVPQNMDLLPGLCP